MMIDSVNCTALGLLEELKRQMKNAMVGTFHNKGDLIEILKASCKRWESILVILCIVDRWFSAYVAKGDFMGKGEDGPVIDDTVSSIN